MAGKERAIRHEAAAILRRIADLLPRPSVGSYLRGYADALEAPRSRRR